MIEIITIILLAFIIILNIFIIIKSNKKQGIVEEINKIIKNENEKLEINLNTKYDSLYKKFNELDERLDKISKDIIYETKNILKEYSEEIKNIDKNQNNNYNELKEKLNNEFKSINDLLIKNNEINNNKLNDSLKDFRETFDRRFEKIEKIVSDNLEKIRNDNEKKLNEIQGVVDEKLQKTLEDRLNKSFTTVLDQINGLNQTVGQIQTLASDVSSLKNVMANVKTKGIIGEVMLDNLISEILTPDQYERQFVIKKGTKEAVDFAIKLPSEDSKYMYIPIDAKFPTESYKNVLDAIDKSDSILLEKARSELSRRLKDEAKSISEKYIEEPLTTNFAILYLPIEGLYAEAMNLNIFEELRRNYKIILSGPSTITATLNALQIGFKSLTIQKKSTEIFNLLATVKKEFNNFASQLQTTQDKYDQAGKELDKLVGTRTRQMNKALNNVEELPKGSKNYITFDKE